MRSGFRIPADHPCLAGHFPGEPIVPGVLVLEQVLRAVQAHIGRDLDAIELPQVKFAAALRPGELAHIELEANASGRIAFRVHCGAPLVASGLVAIGAPAGGEPDVAL